MKKHECCESAEQWIASIEDGRFLIFVGEHEGDEEFIHYCPWCGESLDVGTVELKPIPEVVSLTENRGENSMSIKVDLSFFDDEHVDSIICSMKVFEKWISQEVDKYL